MRMFRICLAGVCPRPRMISVQISQPMPSVTTASAKSRQYSPKRLPTLDSSGVPRDRGGQRRTGRAPGATGATRAAVEPGGRGTGGRAIAGRRPGCLRSLRQRNRGRPRKPTPADGCWVARRRDGYVLPLDESTGDRSDGVRRRSAGPAADGRGPRRARAGARPRPRRRAGGRGRRAAPGRRDRRRLAGGRGRRRGRGLLPGARHGPRRRRATSSRPSASRPPTSPAWPATPESSGWSTWAAWATTRAPSTCAAATRPAASWARRARR